MNYFRTGNDNDENHDDMQFISESNAVKKESYDSDATNLDSTAKDSGPDLSRLATVCFSSDFIL